MGMVVRSNVMAINAFRQLGANNNQVSKSLEKLSSGFRINRAGDDASGLAISEKMKAQIKGLETASSNSQDGISLIQTAEGALTEVHDMLNRMVELAGKAANGTMDANVDRQSLQKEVDALKSEIDRIADGTNFNGIKLLDGSQGAGRAAVTATKATYESGTFTKIDGKGKLSLAGVSVDIDSAKETDLDTQLGKLKTELEKTYKTADWDVAVATGKITITAKKDGSVKTLGLNAPTGMTEKVKGQDARDAVAGSKGLTLQIGDTADEYNKITVSVNDMSTAGLGIEDLDVSDQDKAAASLALLRDLNGGGAINTVSTTRADLGAMQNRLEHTISNLDVAAENMTNANSRIRDTDMAKQMMEYTKMNVLTQAAQAMLAQANQQPQSVLQLLQ